MFHKLSWAVQLAAGVILFAISFLLEGMVLTAFIGEALLAFSLTAALETSKALTIVLYRVMKTQQSVPYPASVRFMVLTFRAALVLLSAACSVMYLAEKLDRPNLMAVRAADADQLKQESAAALRRLGAEHEAEREQGTRTIRQRHQSSTNRLNDRYLPTLRDLEEALSREMGNTVKGRFAGPRYQELQRRLTAEKAAYERELNRLGAEEATELSRRLDVLAERYRQSVAATERDRQQRQHALLTTSYAGDARAEHPIVHAFSGVVAAVLGWHLEALQFVFFFSLFLSVVIELGIVVAFENLTLAQLPIFATEHEVALNIGQKRANTEGELEGFAIDDALERGKVRKQREGMERRMENSLAEALS